jgi:hypothetical protein
MKRLSLHSAREEVGKSWHRFRTQRLFQDRLSFGILIASLLCNAAAFIYLVLRLHPSDFPVPVHYTSLSGFDLLGPWYEIYTIAVFGLAITFVNGFLALKSFSRSRITSFFLLSSSFVVSLLCLIISIAFASIA